MKRFPAKKLGLGVFIFLCIGAFEAGFQASEDPLDFEIKDTKFADLPPLEPGQDFSISDPELGRFLELVLRENPDILAARREWKAGLERPAQVRTLPDPEVGIRYFAESIETRVGPQNTVLELAQQVPWLSKLSTEGRRADHLAASLRETIRRVERDRVRDFKRVYYDLAYFQEALLVNEEERGLLNRFEQIALTRYSTGEGIQQNVIKVQTEITRLLDQNTILGERRKILLRRLAQLMGRPEIILTGKEIHLPDPSREGNGRELEEEARENRPEIRSLREQIQADELLITRRRLDWRPDFRFGIAFTDVGNREDPAGMASPPSDNGTDALALVAGIRIPLYGGRISSGIREAREIQQADFRKLESEQDRVQFEVQEAIIRLDSLLERTALYRNTLIPQAEQSLSSSEAAYQTNQLDFLDLLDAERVWFQVRLAYRRLLSDVWISFSDLERAIGRKYPA